MSSSSSSSVPGYYLRLQRSFSPSVEGRTEGVMLTVEVIEASGLSPNIFVYLQDEVGGDLFNRVASPYDLEVWPSEENKDPEHVFYRAAKVQLILRSAAEAQEVWRLIYADCQELLRSLEMLDEYGDTETVDVVV